MAPCRSGRRGILGSTRGALVEVAGEGGASTPCGVGRGFPDAESVLCGLCVGLEKLSRPGEGEDTASLAGTRRLFPPRSSRLSPHRILVKRRMAFSPFFTR